MTTSDYGQPEESKGMESEQPRYDDVHESDVESADSEHSSFGEQGGQGGADDWSGTYTVEEGDTLSSIAKHFYGDENAYNRIWEANRDKLDNPDMIHPGQELTIPR
jgi:nucleoid-associated protein YgaU